MDVKTYFKTNVLSQQNQLKPTWENSNASYPTSFVLSNNSDSDNTSTFVDKVSPSMNYYKPSDTNTFVDKKDSFNFCKPEDPDTFVYEVPLFNFYKPITDTNQCTNNAHFGETAAFKLVRSYVCQEKYMTSNPEELSIFITYDFPFLVSCIEEYCFGNKKANAPPNMNAVKTIKQMLQDYVIKNYPDSLSEAVKVAARISHHNESCLYLAIEEVILDDKYVASESTASDYTKIMLIAIALDHELGFVDHLSGWIRKQILNSTLMPVKNISLLTIFYTVMCKARNMKQLALDLLYDSLYSFKYRSCPIIAFLLTIWPEIIQKNEHHNVPPDLLSHTIAFCILNTDMCKSKKVYCIEDLHKFMTMEYGYVHGETTCEQFLQYLLNNMEAEVWEKCVLLLCKRQDHVWTYQTVIMKYLFPIIDLWKAEKIVPEWVLIKCINILGQIVRAMTKVTKLCDMKAILDQLNYILCNTDSWKLQEAVFVQLWNISVVKLNFVYTLIRTWKPKDEKVSIHFLNNIRQNLVTGRDIPVSHAWIKRFKLKAVKPNSIITNELQQPNFVKKKGRDFGYSEKM